MAENELYSAYHWAKKAQKAKEETQAIKDSLETTDISQCLLKSGEQSFEGVLTVKGDNHPLVIEGMAGTTATGLQISDSLGAGETDLEHYATGDRYGSRLVNRTSTGAEGTLDLYTTTAGVSILDATGLSSVLVPTPDTGDATNRAASTGFVTNALQAKANADGSNFTATGKAAIVGWGMPDYSAGVSKTWNTNVVAETDGVVIANARADQSTTLKASVNGNVLPFDEIANSGILSISFAVSKGDTYKVYGANGTGTVVFYPFKGVK